MVPWPESRCAIYAPGGVSPRHAPCRFILMNLLGVCLLSAGVFTEPPSSTFLSFFTFSGFSSPATCFKREGSQCGGVERKEACGWIHRPCCGLIVSLWVNDCFAELLLFPLGSNGNNFCLGIVGSIDGITGTGGVSRFRFHHVLAASLQVRREAWGSLGQCLQLVGQIPRFWAMQGGEALSRITMLNPVE